MIEDYKGKLPHEIVKQYVPRWESVSLLFQMNEVQWTYPRSFVLDKKASTQNGMKNAPTPDDLHAYFTELGASGEASNFYDFYASKGWKVGAAPMKDWKAAARRWVKTNKKTSTNDKLGNKITRQSANDLVARVNEISAGTQ